MLKLGGAVISALDSLLVLNAAYVYYDLGGLARMYACECDSARMGSFHKFACMHGLGLEKCGAVKCCLVLF